ncbi:hypothetical protein T484DRAFT_1898887 [Baffinella frigidus]|nr:hypothetical protein T484DRAFT_1898887 [Cryptophyta sp. CCMP2293]
MVVSVKVHQAAAMAKISCVKKERVGEQEEDGFGVRIDNVCGYVDVSVWQRGAVAGQEHSLLVPTEEARDLALDEPDLPLILVVQPAMLDAFEVDLREHGAQGLLPTRDGSDTYIHYTVALVGRTRVLRLDCKVGRDAALDRQPPPQVEVQVSIAGVALSLVDLGRAELVYMSVDDVRLSFVATAPAISFCFSAARAQCYCRSGLRAESRLVNARVTGHADAEANCPR